MNKYLFKCLVIVNLLFTINVIAQDEDKITVMSKITCECINNIPDKEWRNNPKEKVEDCFNASVLGGLLSLISDDLTQETDSLVVEIGSNKVKNGDSVINKIDESDLELTKQQLRKNCDRYKTFENESSSNIKQISDQACECIGKIDIGLEKEKANDSINSCITTAIISDQVQNDLMGELSKTIDSISSSQKEFDSLVIEDDKEILLSTDKDYAKIEEHLLRSCQKLQVLISSDNTKHENSISNHDKALEFYDEGVSHFRNGNYKKALPKFKKAVKIDKTFAFAWDNLGVCQRKLGKLEEAINSYNKSLELDPLGRMPLMNIPVAYEMLKDYDNAILAYERFLGIYPKDPEGYYGIARMYHLKVNYEDALDNIFKAYLMYKEIQSPYSQDAERNIAIFYNEMKEKGMLKTFNEIANKYNIKIDK